MTNTRLALMTGAWVLAAGAVAVTIAVIVTEVLVFAGTVSRSGPGYGRSLAVVTGGVFVFLAFVPFVFRDRFTDVEDGEGP